MKKILAMLLCATTLLMSACGQVNVTPPSNQSSSQAESSDPTKLPESFDLVMTFGSETSSTYAMGIQIGEYFNKIAPNIKSTVKTGASGSNVELTDAGQTVISHTQSDLIYAALEGTEPFTSKKTNMRGIATVMESTFHMAVPADSPVNSFDDIIENKYPLKISVGAQGSGIESLFRKILNAYDVTYEDIESWGGKIEFLSMSEAATLFKDNQLNAVTILAGVPYSGITEVATARDVKFIGISDDVKSKLLTLGYLDKAIPADSYKGQDEEIPSIGVAVSVITNANANEAVIYEITKFLNSEDGISILSDINAGYAGYMKGPETGVEGMSVELHPGAARYYKEAGVLE